MRRSVLIPLCSIIISFIAEASYAQSPAIYSGLSYLSTAQKADGSWAGNTTTSAKSSFASLEAFSVLGKLDSEYQAGLQWCQAYPVINIDYLSNRIILLSQNGLSITDDLATLLSLRNIDAGGWGLKSYSSDNLDTALALQALKAANYSDLSVVNAGLAYLTSSQNIDGGWGFYKGNSSNVYMTAIVSTTLQQFPQTTTLVTAIGKATSYLRSRQNADGGFGSSLSAVTPAQAGPSTVYETAFSLQCSYPERAGEHTGTFLMYGLMRL